MIRHIINKITETRWKYSLQNSDVRIQGKAFISSSVNIRNSYIYVAPNSKLIIKDNVKIDGVGLYLYDGELTIGEYTIIEKEKNSSRPEYIIDGKSSANIADHVRLRCQRLWCRFGGRLSIGPYTNINTFSEVRCDKSVDIGGYCMISYNTRIWDTNTHNVYPAEERRKLTEKYFPTFGHETERPKTKAVKIGDDCWLGEGAAILKGTVLGDGVIVGFNTTISNQYIMNGKTVVSLNEIKIL